MRVGAPTARTWFRSLGALSNQGVSGDRPGRRDARRVKQLRVWNTVLAFAHALQGIAILALANDTTIPITWSFIDGPPATGDVSTETLYDLPFGPAVAAFLFLAVSP